MKFRKQRTAKDPLAGLDFDTSFAILEMAWDYLERAAWVLANAVLTAAQRLDITLGYVRVLSALDLAASGMEAA